MNRTRIGLSLLLCLAGGALSLTLLSTHYGVALLGEAVLAACGEGGGCDIVSQSRYAVFLGLPLAAFGLLFYGALLALLAPAVFKPTADGDDPALSFGFFLTAAAIVIDLVLFGLQIFVIKAFCKFCIATYGVNLLLLGCLWPFRQPGQALNFLFAPPSRNSLVSWVVAGLATAAATVAGDAAMADRKALASSSILGIPTMLQAPDKSAPALPGSVEEQLAAARAEAKKWKDTLDNEASLQVYLNQKARDDFNQTPITTLDLALSPAQGPKAAAISVVSYSDFMCPFCRDLANGLKGYLPTTGDRVAIHFKHFPLDISCNPGIGRTVHQGACELSLGGICAEESGRFWEYHDKIFSQRWETATREDVLRIGASVGLDAGKLGACLTAAATKGRLAKDIEEGTRVGVGSTPTVFINGRKLKSTNTFLLAVEEEQKRLKLPALPIQPIPQPR